MKKTFILLAALLVLVLTGCAARVPYKVVPDFGNRGIRTIAVLPVNDKTGDAKAGQMLRGKLVQALYFKGYPKMAPEAVDAKLAQGRPVYSAAAGGIDPQTAGSLTGAQALLYCTLETLHTSYLAAFARMSVAIDFTLRSAATGEVLWQARYATAETCSDITRNRLKIKSCQIYEESLQEAVDKALATLPDRVEAAK
jgi:hypothetical protein